MLTVVDKRSDSKVTYMHSDFSNRETENRNMKLKLSIDWITIQSQVEKKEELSGAI